MSTFRKPPKRRSRLVQKKTTENSDNSDAEKENKTSIASVEDLIARKKQRVERQNNLSQIFDRLNRDREEKEANGEYGIDLKPKTTERKSKRNTDDDEFDIYAMLDVPRELEDKEQTIHLKEFNDYFLFDAANDSSSDEELDDKNVVEASTLLGEDQHEQLVTLIENSHKDQKVKEMEKKWTQEFLFSGNKNTRQPHLISQELGIGQKEIHISEMSATSKGRAFLLESGCMKLWHHSGWKCPNYIYQWLFEVIALEENKIATKNALSTLFVLWSLPGMRVETKLEHIYKQRYIHLKTFKSILLAYDAIPSQLIEGVLSSPEEEDLIIHRQNRKDFDDKKCIHISLSQLGGIIKAFGFSVRLWAKAYTSYEIRHAIRLLLQISIDKVGCLVIQEIQTAIDNCLSAMKESNWETEVKTIANDVCDLISSTRSQVHVFDAVKTIYERSRYLRRVIGVTCLERCLEKEVPGSIDYISTDQSLVQQISQIFNNPKGFFMLPITDYEECYNRVAMLDAAIGMDDEEIKRDKDTIIVISEQLRGIGFQIGAKLGVMERTLANEMVQRVWGRISYIVGKKSLHTL